MDAIQQYALMDVISSHWDAILLRLGKPDPVRDCEIQRLVTAIARAEDDSERNSVIILFLKILRESGASEYIDHIVNDVMITQRLTNISRLDNLYNSLQIVKDDCDNIPDKPVQQMIGKVVGGFIGWLPIAGAVRELVAVPARTRSPHYSILNVCASLKKKAAYETDPCRVTLYFATDRLPGGDGEDLFTSEGSDENSFGRADVTIPIYVHKKGRVERQKFWEILRDKNDPRRYMVVASTNTFSFDSFAREIGDSFDSKREVLVFVHGYNVDFETAALRASQIAYDLGFSGRVILYSWPSKGKYSGYPSDEEQVETSFVHFNKFLSTIKAGPWDKIHILAHSMGNRIILYSLAGSEWPDNRIGQVIFAAADIAVDIFRQRFPDLLGKATAYTSYSSRYDRALLISEKFHQRERVGFPRKTPFVMKGLETVDASTARAGVLGHGYFAENPSILKDLSKLLERGMPASQRGLQLTANQTYWSFTRS